MFLFNAHQNSYEYHQCGCEVLDSRVHCTLSRKRADCNTGIDLQNQVVVHIVLSPYYWWQWSRKMFVIGGGRIFSVTYTCIHMCAHACFLCV